MTEMALLGDEVMVRVLPILEKGLFKEVFMT
jgi:hypothetical protein